MRISGCPWPPWPTWANLPPKVCSNSCWLLRCLVRTKLLSHKAGGKSKTALDCSAAPFSSFLRFQPRYSQDFSVFMHLKKQLRTLFKATSRPPLFSWVSTATQFPWSPRFFSSLVWQLYRHFMGHVSHVLEIPALLVPQLGRVIRLSSDCRCTSGICFQGSNLAMVHDTVIQHGHLAMDLDISGSVLRMINSV